MFMAFAVMLKDLFKFKEYHESGPILEIRKSETQYHLAIYRSKCPHGRGSGIV